MAGSIVFVTGGTGALGRALLPLLVERNLDELVLLARNPAMAGTLVQRAHDGKRRRGWWGKPHIRIISGDVSRAHLGFSVETRREMAQRVTAILHLAATTRFDRPLGEARRINVRGTENVLGFAERCPSLQKIGVVSTVYVSGKRTGTIFEHERVHGAGFVNTYEQSKYEAEQVVESRWDALPVAVYRLSTILGHSTTGEVLHFTAPHHAVRMLHLGLAAMISGVPGGHIDLLPGDIAARTLCTLFFSHFRPRMRFHIAAGPTRSFTLREMVHESYRLLALQDPAWERRRYPRPVIASRATFDLFTQSAAVADNELFRRVLATTQHFAEQLLYPKEFDLTNTLRALPRYLRDLPHVRDYYPKVINYCLQSRWGRL